MDKATAAKIVASTPRSERRRMVRDLRRKSLRELGGTVRRDNIALAPDEDPDDPKGS